MSKSAANLKERRFNMFNRILSIFCAFVAAVFFYLIFYTFQVESLGEVWPSIWGLLWGKLMLLDLYLGFFVIALLMRELCHWSVSFTLIFLLLCCIFGNGVSLIAIALVFYRKVND